MNCEKCKNKKATVFYADDGGGQHALCTSCAESLGKLASYSEAAASDFSKSGQFVPESSLLALCSGQATAFPLYASRADGAERKCPFCSTSLSMAERTGRVGCPEC